MNRRNIDVGINWLINITFEECFCVMATVILLINENSVKYWRCERKGICGGQMKRQYLIWSSN